MLTLPAMREPKSPNETELALAYLRAKRTLLDGGFAWEIVQHRRRTHITEEGFLRESAWVILNAGIREQVVRGVFPAISAAFFQWASAKQIASRSTACKRAALAVFHHQGKISAVVDVATSIANRGFEAFWSKVVADPLETLRQLPFVGPVTVYHLAKNLGFDTAKPDRHMARLANQLNFAGAHELAHNISSFTGDPVAMVDSVLWRFCNLFGPAALTSASWSSKQRSGLPA